MKKIREKFIAVTVVVMIIIMTLSSVCNVDVVKAANRGDKEVNGCTIRTYESNAGGHWYISDDWRNDIFEGEGKSCEGMKFSVAKFIVEGGRYGYLKHRRLG